jgi:homogentisate 1,2-dioxygenase
MFLQQKGKFAPQAHVGIPEGTFEEEHGRRGFFGKCSHIYRKHAPTGWLKIEGPCKPQAFDMNKLASKLDPWVPAVLLENKDVKIGFMRPKGGVQPYYFRDADGDVVYFIHQGSGVLETDFGNISYKRGDYLVVPRGTTTRFNAEPGEHKYLVIESAGEIELPNKGLLGPHALFDPSTLVYPEIAPQLEAKESVLWIKRMDQITKVTYPFSPLDTLGWKGDLSVVKINIQDIRPIVSPRYHLPPSVHTTFLTNAFVICSFVPRPFEEDPQAQRVPFYHRNIDFDEVIFYHDGDFFSRQNIGPGMVTFHPQGIHHGPHPKADSASRKKTHTDEYAVMVDTRNPLLPTKESAAAEWLEYHMSWKEN